MWLKVYENIRGAASIFEALINAIIIIITPKSLTVLYHHNPTTRILQDQSFFFSFSVMLRVPPSISGTESRIIKPLVAKRPGKKSHHCMGHTA